MAVPRLNHRGCEHVKAWPADEAAAFLTLSAAICPSCNGGMHHETHPDQDDSGRSIVRDVWWCPCCWVAVWFEETVEGPAKR